MSDDHTLGATTYDGSDPATYGGVDVAGGSPGFEDVLINGGVIVEPLTGIRAYASYAEGYTAPDVGRITRAVEETGVDIDNFLDISPIVSNNREIGVEVKRGPLDASATYFWSTSKNGQRDRKSTRLKLQSLMRISYAVFCLKKKKYQQNKEYTRDATSNTSQHNTE